jgi:hypothetical protein
LAEDAVTAAAALRSVRSREYVRDFLGRLRPYQQDPRVKEFVRPAGHGSVGVLTAFEGQRVSANTRLLWGHPWNHGRVPSEEVRLAVEGWPPAKNEAKSMLAAGHVHADRVVRLLEAARVAGATAAVPVFGRAPLGLELVLRSPDQQG